MFETILILIFFLIVNIAPIVIIGPIVSILGVFSGIITPFANYFIGISSELDFFCWNGPTKDDEPARISYFFGPGMSQLKSVIRKIFQLNSQGNLTKSIHDAIDDKSINAEIILTWPVVKIIFDIFSIPCLYGLSIILCSGFAVLHCVLILFFVFLKLPILSVAWLIDRLFIKINGIQSECSICKNRFTIPAFECPDCGRKHKKLVPGVYGSFRHKCICGKKLPSTIINGRSNLKSFCPICESSLVASDARQICFQLVGGTKAGKSVYLAALFHEYLGNLKKNVNITLEIKEEYQPYFDELEEWYQGAEVPATSQLDAQMYPLLIDCHNMRPKIQFSVYDVAGEKFDQIEASGVLPPYCNGYLFLIDPFASGLLRVNREQEGESLADFSDKEVADIATNFINFLVNMGQMKVNEMSSKPLAVLIAKADVREVKREIGPAKIDSLFRKEHLQNPNVLYETIRDEKCRQFLQDIGLANVIDILETQFKEVHFFPISSMGHEKDGDEYEPWGVIEPIKWLLQMADRQFSNVVFPK